MLAKLFLVVFLFVSVANAKYKQEDIAIALYQCEQVAHIWSGWKGKCQYGIFFDSQFDLGFFMSMAMSMYSAAGEGYFGNDVADSVNGMQRSLGEYMGGQSYYVGDMGGGGVTGLEGATYEGFGARLIKDADMNTIAAGTQQGFMERVIANAQNPMNYLGTATSLLSMAAPPSQQEKQAAWNYQQAWVGAPTNDPAAQAYASCMSSLNLSFVNHISYSAGDDENGTGRYMQAPWENPIRISYEDWAGLQVMSGAGQLDPDADQTNGYQFMNFDQVNNFAVANYAVVATDEIGVTLIAKDQVAYTQLGQIICAGYRVANQINVLNKETSKQADTGAGQGMAGQALAMMGVKQAINILPPPYNMIGNIVLTFISSFSSGNACEDEDFAIARGSIQWKTYKFSKQGQCHFIKDKCAKKYFWGACMTHQKDFCCYDQITTRIFVESAKEQLGKTWDSCSDIEIGDLKKLGFRRCGTGESPAANKCMSQALYGELRESLIRQVSKGVPIDSIEGQIKNSMGMEMQ